MFGRAFLLAFLLSSAVLPIEWLHAAPPSIGPTQESTPQDDGSDQKDFEATLARQAKRDAIQGVDTERLKDDPNFTNGQFVEVETWRRVGFTGLRRDEQELILTDMDHPEGVRYGKKVVRYDLDKINAGYSAPPSYSLREDVTVKIKHDRVEYEYVVVQRKQRLVYRHTFMIPGVQSVSKNDMYSNLLVRNGDVRQAVMANTRLFQANQTLKGGPVALVVVDAIDALETGEPAPIDPRLRLVPYDSREMKTYENPCKGFTGDDVLVRELPEGRKQVVRLIEMHGQMEALKGHHRVFKLREDLLKGEKPFVDILNGIDSGTLEVMGRQDLLTSLDGVGNTLRGLASPGQSHAYRRTPAEWERSPAELTHLESHALEQMGLISDHAVDFAAKPQERSTYPIDAGKPDPETDEGREFAALSDLATRAQGEIPKRTWMGWAKANAPVAGMYAMGIAALNLWMYLMPSSPFFHRLKAFDVFGVDGRIVPYWFKFWMVGGACALFFWALLPITFATFSARVLRRPTVWGPRAGLLRTIETGWRSYAAVGMRAASYFMISFRRRAAAACELVGIKGPSGLLQAMYFGVSPREYLNGVNFDKANHLKGPARILKIAELKVRRFIGGNSAGEDPSELVAERETARIHSYHLAFYLLIRRLFEMRILPAEVPISGSTLRQYVQGEAFGNLEKRFEAAARRIEQVMSEEPLAPNLSTQAAAEILTKDPMLAGCLENPTGKLSAEELELIKEVKTSGVWARRWARAAGNEELFLKYHNGTPGQKMADITAEVNQNDNTTNFFSMGAAPGPTQFSSMQNVQQLAASDQGPLGLMGTQAAAENFGTNAAGWVSMMPCDAADYDEAGAVEIPISMRNPQSFENEHNVLDLALRRSRPATFTEAMGRYLSCVNPLGSGFWSAVQGVGERITIAQLKTWKPLIFVGFLTCVIAFMMDPPAALKELSIREWVPEIFNRSLGKTLLQEALSYMVYRICWQVNAKGIIRSTTEVRENALTLAAIVRDITAASTKARMADDGDTREVSQHLERLVAFYDHYGAKLPARVFESDDVLEQADRAALATLASPPIPTTRNENAAFAYNQSVGVITTVASTVMAGLSWAFTENIDWRVVGVVLVATYAFGRTAIVAGANARAHFDYSADLEQLRNALMALEQEDSEANRDRAFSMILRAALTYRRYGEQQLLEHLNLERLTRQADLVSVGKQLYASMLASPPTDNRSVRKAQARESATAFCANAVRAAGQAAAN